MTETRPSRAPDRSRSPGAGSALRRRSFLAAVAAGTAWSGGCVRRARSLAAADEAERVALTIKTTPTDDDPYAIRLAQRLAGHLEAVGVGVDVLPMRNDQLLRDVLVEQSFEVYVAAHPGGSSPDFLYPLLHSRYVADPGWQNPFGYADPATDALLERQRRESSGARRETVSDLQRVVASEQPFSVVCFPVSIRAVRPDRFDGWTAGASEPPLQYLALRRDRDGPVPVRSGRTPPDGSAGPDGTLRVALTDGRPTQNLNPIAVSFRNRRTVTDLLYDPLLRRYRGDPLPWLAASWRWERRSTDPGPVAVVGLREDLAWHDGRPITADDVAFTYRFLADTSLGRADRPVPAPRFRGRGSLVAGVEPIDRRAVRVEFASTTPEIGLRALTVPLLPAHEWEPRSDPAELAGLGLAGRTTEALVWPNMDPVGSGPFSFGRAVKDETLILDRFEDHFAWDRETTVPGRLSGQAAFDRLAFRIVPSDGAAIELLAAGQVDTTGSGVHARAVPKAVRSDGVRLVDRPGAAFYHVGYNTRREPLSDRRFRRAVSRLIDEEWAAIDVFGGYADPAASPLARSDWLAPGLEWSGRDPALPFPGEDGRLDVERARRLFEAAGYRYDETGRLRGDAP